MKTCSHCGKSYPLSRVLCLDCVEILEERFYIRLIVLTFVAAFAIHLALGKWGYTGRGLIMESLMTEAALLVFAVLLWKSFQKWKSPQRRILYELASLYSDRTGRIVVFTLATVLVLFFSGFFAMHPPKELSEPDLLHSFRIVRTRVLLVFGSAYVIVVFYIQGLDFFDLSLKNSFLRKEGSRPEKIP